MYNPRFMMPMHAICDDAIATIARTARDSLDYPCRSSEYQRNVNERNSH